MSASTLSQRPAVPRVSSPFVHLLWKEFRSQRALVLSLTLLGVFAQWLFRMSLSVQRGNSAATTIFGVVFLVPLMVALGSSVLLFAWEKEERTWNLLRVLPMSRNDLFFAKFGLGFLTTVASFGLLWLTAWLLAPQPYSPEKHRDVLLWGANALLLFTWGVFFSLLTGRVLTALVAAPLCMILSTALPYAHVLIPVLAVVDYWLTGRWIDDKPLVLPKGLRKRKARSVPKSFLFVTDHSDPWLVSFSRLVWIEWQNAKPFLKLILGVGMIVMVVGSVKWFHFAFTSSHIPFLFVLFVPLLAGVWSFQGEQHQKRFRLAAHRGVSAQPLWLSKHAVWFPVALFAPLFLILCHSLLLYFYFNYLKGNTHGLNEGLFGYRSILDSVANWIGQNGFRSPSFLEIGGAMLMYAGVAYAFGQFASMLLPRTVTAAIVSLPLLVAALFWWGFLITFQIPVSWTVGPIAVVFVLATLLRSSDWLMQRQGWRRWIKVALVLLSPVPFVVAGIAVHRVTEIPARATAHTAYKQAKGTGYMWLLQRFERGFPDPPFVQRAAAPWTVPKGNTQLDASIPTVVEFQQNRVKVAFDNIAALLPTADESSELLAFVRKEFRLAETPGTREVAHGFRNSMRQRMREYTESAAHFTAAGQLEEALKQLMLGAQFLRLYSEYCNLDMFQLGLSGMSEDYRQRMLAWLDHRDQTPELALSLTRVMDAEFSRFAQLSAKVLENRTVQIREFERFWEASVADLNSQFSTDGPYPHVTELITVRRFLPWEKYRIQRLIDVSAAAFLQDAIDLDRKLMPGGREDLAEWLDTKRMHWANDYRVEPFRWWQTTVAVPWNWAGRTNSGIELHRLLNATIHLECRNRAMVLTGAIVAYRLRNHRLPESLDKLVPEFVSAVPTDPWSGHDFGYKPDGFPAPLKLNADKSLDAKIPILWSSGMFGEPQEIVTRTAMVDRRLVKIDPKSEFKFDSRGNHNLYNYVSDVSGPDLTKPLVIAIPMGWQPIEAVKPALPQETRFSKPRPHRLEPDDYGSPDDRTKPDAF